MGLQCFDECLNKSFLSLRVIQSLNQSYIPELILGETQVLSIVEQVFEQVIQYLIRS